MRYKYQMHTHTSPCSFCAGMAPEGLVKAIHECGYAGIVLTNHFMGGNTGINRNTEWEYFVRQYELDYENCVEAAKEYDVDIIFGIEEHIGGGLEILIYGVTPDILYQYEELRQHELEAWRKIADKHNLLIIQAHPFRERPSIRQPGVLPLDMIDGIEVYNHGNKPEDNIKAREFAASNPGLILTSGADTHSIDTVFCGGIQCSRRIKNEKDLVSILRSGEYEVIEV